jgi:hypothetical protein
MRLNIQPVYAGLDAFCLKGSSTPDYNLFTSTGNAWGIFKAGEIVSAYVNFTSSTGTYFLSVADYNESVYATVESPPGQSASQTDVEVINTLGYCSTASGFCPQTKYTPVGIGSKYSSAGCAVFFPAPCVWLTKNGNVQLLPLGHMPTGTLYTKYEMITPGGKLMAVPSTFASDHTSFTITFKNAGT